MKKILVTGGAGFIGSWVVDYLIEDGHLVTIIDDLSSGKKNFINPKAHFFDLDIRNEGVEKIFKTEAFDIVIHHAAQISVRKSVENPMHDASINIIGLLNILEQARKYKVQKVIFASSGGAIYGEAKIVPTPEDYYPLIPLSPYGVAKLSSELYLSYYSKVHNLPSLCLRYSNVYGPRQDPHGEAGVVAIFSQKLLSSDQPIIVGDGKQVRDFVYVEDVARANTLAVLSHATGAINIGTGKGTDIVTLFHQLNYLTGARKSEIHGPPKLGEQQQSILDIRNASKILLWEPKVGLNEGLKKIVDAFRQ